MEINLAVLGIYGIWALDSSNIYFAVGAIVKYEGGKFIETNLGDLGFTQFQGVNKLWGSSEQNIWGVGPEGTIVHYDGKSWARIDFPRQWYLFDITGDLQSGIAYAAAMDSTSYKAIVKLESSSAQIIYKSPQISSIKPNGLNYLNGNLYLAGSDFQCTLLWRYRTANGEIDSLYTVAPTTGLFNITGESENDLYFWGNDYRVGKLVHYNGSRFKVFNLPNASYTAGGAATKGNISAFAGLSNNKGFVILVNRNDK